MTSINSNTALPPGAPAQKEIGRAACTVHALSVVSGLSVAQATDVAVKAGTRNGQRFSSSMLIDHAKTNGMHFKKLRFTKKTLRKFIAEHPNGRYYLRKIGHAFAVVNGLVSDQTPHGSIVLAAWEFVGEGK